MMRRPRPAAYLMSSPRRATPSGRRVARARSCGALSARCSPSSRLCESTVAYVINEPCIGVKDLSCTEVCPVDCIHPTMITQAVMHDTRPPGSDARGVDETLQGVLVDLVDLSLLGKHARWNVEGVT